MSSKRISFIAPFVLFCFFIFTYIHNLSRSVYGGDVGDLITASSVMGVAHPPGYPLFTLLGFILTRFDISTPAFMVGLISVVSSSLSVLLFYLLAQRFAKNKLISLISALILGFNYIFWIHSEIAEVFALNGFFVVILFLLAILLKEKKEIKYFFLLAFFTGLSLTNHHTIVLIFPSLLILISGELLKIIRKPKELFKGFLLGILGFSVYLYVPLASMQNPPINWDSVKDFDSFVHLFLRKDFGTFSAGLFPAPYIDERFVILKTYLQDTFTQLTIPVVILSALGMITLFLNNKRFFFSFILAFLLSGPLFITYAGFPLTSGFLVGVYERFFVMPLIIFLFFFPFGLKAFADIMNKILKKKRYETLFIAVFLIIPFSLFYYNFPKTDLSNVYIGDRLAYDIINPLPKDSVLLLAGDTNIFNSLYFVYSLKQRTDVKILNINALEADSYFLTKQKEYINKFPGSVKNEDLSFRIIDHISASRPVYSSNIIQPSKGEKIIWMPYGLTYKYLSSKDQIPEEKKYIEDTIGVIESFKKKNESEKNSVASGSLTITDIPITYANALLATGNFIFAEYGNRDIAIEFFKKAISYNPTYYKSYSILGIYYLNVKDCKNAANNFSKSIDLYPYERTTYIYLYGTYSLCFNDKNKQKEVADMYKETFKRDFLEDTKQTVDNKQ